MVIHIGWEYFLGIVGLMITGTWFLSGRFGSIEGRLSKVEEAIEWLKKGWEEFFSVAQNKKTQFFESKSPIQLTSKGQLMLEQSGMKLFVDRNRSELIERCSKVTYSNLYDVQQFIFGLFYEISLDKETENKVKNHAYQEGIGPELIRKVGAIYFRDLFLKHLGMNISDVDQHDPNNHKK